MKDLNWDFWLIIPKPVFFKKKQKNVDDGKFEGFFIEASLG